jgi:NADH:ubiquinone oxidoreductase subunit E
LSKQIGVPLSQLYSLATFYSFFELQPVGRHIITVCQGTACHVKGAPRILSALEDLLGIKREETTPDRKFSLTTNDLEFTLNTARCFGACSMAPVIRVDGKVYGYNTPEKLPQILKRYGWREK